MGEPLASSIAKWYANFFVKKNNPIVNTYFQPKLVVLFFLQNLMISLKIKLTVL